MDKLYWINNDITKLENENMKKNALIWSIIASEMPNW